MSKAIDFSYVNHNGKKVNGAAAFNHYVYTEKGGIQNYNDEVGFEYIKEFVRQCSPQINDNLEKQIRRSRFKAV